MVWRRVIARERGGDRVRRDDLWNVCEEHVDVFDRSRHGDVGEVATVNPGRPDDHGDRQHDGARDRGEL